MNGYKGNLCEGTNPCACGGQAYTYSNHIYITIYCGNCEIGWPGTNSTLEEIVDKWNRTFKTPPPDPGAASAY